MISLWFGTKLAKRDKRSGKSLEFLEKPRLDSTMNYSHCCGTFYFSFKSINPNFLIIIKIISNPRIEAIKSYGSYTLLPPRL